MTTAIRFDASYFARKGREEARFDADAGFPMPTFDYLRACGRRLYWIQPLVTEMAAATAYAKAYIDERQRVDAPR